MRGRRSNRIHGMGKITSPYFSGGHQLTYQPYRLPGQAALTAAFYNQLSTGFDTIKSHTKTGTTQKKVEKLKPKEIARGWYADYMTGFMHKFPKSFEAVVNSSGKQVYKRQVPVLQDGIQARVNKITLYNGLELTDIQGITDVGVTTYVTSSRWKLMWTNLSNVKMCYEYYYVTPIGEQATTFQDQVTSLTNTLNISTGFNDVYTIWRPEDTPQVLKNWRILSKSVFRLAPGETGEIHCKDSVYAKFGDAIQTLDRTYAAKYNTQLYCRWYGAPTAVATTAIAPAEPNPTDATFGAAGTATAWILENQVSYYRGVQAQPNLESWSTSVIANVPGGKVIVTEAEEDLEIVAAE